MSVADFGPAVELVGQIDSDLAPYTHVIAEILEDPALPEVVSLVGEIADTYPSAPSGGPPGPPGVGLSSAIFPLKVFLYGRTHWWFFPVLGLTLLAIPVAVGYGIGRRHPR